MASFTVVPSTLASSVPRPGRHTGERHWFATVKSNMKVGLRRIEKTLQTHAADVVCQRADGLDRRRRGGTIVAVRGTVHIGHASYWV